MDFIKNGNYDESLQAFMYKNTATGKMEQLHNFVYSKVNSKYKYSNPGKDKENDRFLQLGKGDFYKNRKSNFMDAKPIRKIILYRITDDTYHVLSQEEMNDILTIEASL